MSEFKGTKGKWIIKDRVGYIQSENTGESITCWTGVAVSNYSLKEIEYKANSLLISKAPEMLEALQMQIDSLDLSNFDFYNKYGFNVSELTEKQRLLIKEATTL